MYKQYSSPNNDILSFLCVCIGGKIVSQDNRSGCYPRDVDDKYQYCCKEDYYDYRPPTTILECLFECIFG